LFQLVTATITTTKTTATIPRNLSYRLRSKQERDSNTAQPAARNNNNKQKSGNQETNWNI